MKKICLLMIVCCAAFSHASFSLNIVLTNDDGWMTKNVQVLKAGLTKAGHNVLLVAPCTGQSAKGGSFFFFKPIPVDTSRASQNEYCVGETDTSKPYKDFGPGTPVTAVYYALDVLVPALWESNVDLLISGPNEGINVGFAVQNSGTVNAAMVAISRGLPAIAVSAHAITETDEGESHKVASFVLELIAKLQKSRSSKETMLPEHMGLSVNLPKHVDAHKGLRFVHTGWSSLRNPRFSTDMSTETDGLIEIFLNRGRVKNLEEAHLLLQPLQKNLAGKGGIVFGAPSAASEADANSEGKLLAEGYVTISTLEANGDLKFNYMKSRLSGM
jgi:5'-nucleotidase